MATNEVSANSGSQPDRKQQMLSRAEDFCKAFIAGTKPSDMLDTHFSSSGTITEHGPSWANASLPFLAKTFRGRRASSSDDNAELTQEEKTTCDDYFDLLGATLSLVPHEETLPPREGYVVDPDAVIRGSEDRGVVMVRAHARLGAIETRKSWDEEFIFVFSAFGDGMKIGRMEIWADNLSAWKGIEI